MSERSHACGVRFLSPCLSICPAVPSCLWPLTPLLCVYPIPSAAFAAVHFVWLTAFIVCLCRCVCVCCLCLVQIRAAFPSCSEEALAFNSSSVSLCQEIHNQGFMYQAVLALEKRFNWSESEWEALQSAGGQLYSRPAASSVCVSTLSQCFRCCGWVSQMYRHQTQKLLMP